MKDREPPDGRDTVEDDPGPPIPELAELAEPAMPSFEAAVQNRIQRKLFGAHVVNHVFFTPVMVVIEFVRLAFEMLGRIGESNGRPTDE